MPYPYYVVWKGRTTGVFDNYDAVKESVSGFSDAKWKGCLSRLAAKEALRAGPPARSTKNMLPIQLTPPSPQPSQKRTVKEEDVVPTPKKKKSEPRQPATDPPTTQTYVIAEVEEKKTTRVRLEKVEVTKKFFT